MNLIPKKYFMLFLAALLVLALGYMAVNTSKTSKQTNVSTDAYSKDLDDIKSQSDSDDLDSIEKDLDETDTKGVDEELENIGKEMDQ